MSVPVVLLVHVEIDTARITEFRDLIAFDAAESVTKENGGCLRFDVIEVPSPLNNKFIFYEVYANEEAKDYHMTTPHFNKFNEFRSSGGLLSITIDTPKAFALGTRRVY